MTTGPGRIELPRFVRDVRVLHRASDRGASGRPKTAGGILRPFSGVLGLEPWRSEWPLPALSFLRLTPQVLPTLRETRWSPSRVEAPATSEREGSERSEGDDDSSGEELRVRDLLSIGSQGLGQNASEDRKGTSSPEGTDPGRSGIEIPRIPRSADDAIGPGSTRVRTRWMNDRGEGDRFSIGDRRPDGAEAERSARNAPETGRGATLPGDADPSDRGIVGRAKGDRSVGSSFEGSRAASDRGETGESTQRYGEEAHVDPPTRSLGTEDRREIAPAIGDDPRHRRGRDVDALSLRSVGEVDDRGGPGAGEITSVDAPRTDTALATDRPSMEPLRGVITRSTDRAGAPSGEVSHQRRSRGSAGPQPSRRHTDTQFGHRGTTSTSPREGDPSNGDRSRSERRNDPNEPRQLDEFVDVDRLADRLARVFERKARIERERRGR